MNKILPAGIYGITAEKFSKGRSNIEVVEEMIRGGIGIIQYREKHKDKSILDIYQECRTIRDLTRRSGVIFIVNDFVDIALLVDADGVHVGQDDLPVSEVRRLVGAKIIGVSTHTPEQAAVAVENGADYIGVGPIFKTHTKENICDPVGLSYLEDVVSHVPLPFVAIGGIKKHNISEVIRRGTKTVCLVSEIVGADDIAKTVRKLKALTETTKSNG